jgi:hypothetical protein
MGGFRVSESQLVPSIDASTVIVPVGVPVHTQWYPTLSVYATFVVELVKLPAILPAVMTENEWLVFFRAI